MKTSIALLIPGLSFIVAPTRADETCSSLYLARIEGQEEFLHVWTFGVDGLGDGSDKFVTLDVKPGSPNYGKVIHSRSVGGRHEAHHGGSTDERRELWLSGRESSQIFSLDVHANPAHPQYVKTIGDFVQTSGGAVGAKDAGAMKRFGGSMALWDFHTRKPKKVFSVPGAPLEIRWSWGEKHNDAFTAIALTSKLGLCYEDEKGEWLTKEVATISSGGGV